MAGHTLQRVTFIECRWITEIDERSNHTYSEFSSHHLPWFFWKVAGVVDRTALEMQRTGNCTGGSNPSLSAHCEKNFLNKCSRSKKR